MVLLVQLIENPAARGHSAQLLTVRREDNLSTPACGVTPKNVRQLRQTPDISTTRAECIPNPHTSSLSTVDQRVLRLVDRLDHEHRYRATDPRCQIATHSSRPATWRCQPTGQSNCWAILSERSRTSRRSLRGDAPWSASARGDASATRCAAASIRSGHSAKASVAIG
jgi:hypothetical protein